jgi:hypothetical protein
MGSRLDQRQIRAAQRSGQGCSFAWRLGNGHLMGLIGLHLQQVRRIAMLTLVRPPWQQERHQQQQKGDTRQGHAPYIGHKGRNVEAGAIRLP